MIEVLTDEEYEAVNDRAREMWKADNSIYRLPMTVYTVNAMKEMGFPREAYNNKSRLNQLKLDEELKKLL